MTIIQVCHTQSGKCGIVLLFYKAINQRQSSAHLLFDIHHINSFEADPDIDSFAFSPLENPLCWFVNLTNEESAPVCVVKGKIKPNKYEVI